MRVALTGVLEDGTPRRAGVPVNPRTTLNVPQGVDLELVVDVVTSSGVGVNLEVEGTELLLTVKRRPSESTPRIVRKASLAGRRGTFLVEPGATRRLLPGLFSFDVWLTKNGLRNPVIPLSPFNLQAANAAVPAQPPPPVVEVVENDTDPLVLDFTPTVITGQTINLNVATEPTATVLAATIITATTANVDTSGLPVGRFAAEIENVTTGKTSDVFILDVRAEIA